MNKIIMPSKNGKNGVDAIGSAVRHGRRFRFWIAFRSWPNLTLTKHFNHGWTYWNYGVMSVLAPLFGRRMVPETKGRSLEQMEELWPAKAS
jgi:hypothetical protein